MKSKKSKLIGLTLGLMSGAAVLALGTGMASAAPEAAKSAAVSAGSTFSVDTVHSSVIYKIKHAGLTNFYGRFNKFDGSFSLDPANPGSGKFEVTIEADSIDSGNAQRDGHLKNPDFFNTKQFPTITFKSTGIKKAGDHFELTGDMTLMGQTKPITAKLEWGGEGDRGARMGYRAGCEATFTFKRSDFGMKYGLEGNMLGDDVTVTVALAGAKK